MSYRDSGPEKAYSTSGYIQPMDMPAPPGAHHGANLTSDAATLVDRLESLAGLAESIFVRVHGPEPKDVAGLAPSPTRQGDPPLRHAIDRAHQIANAIEGTLERLGKRL